MGILKLFAANTMHFLFCWHGCDNCLPAKIKGWWDVLKPITKAVRSLYFH